MSRELVLLLLSIAMFVADAFAYETETHRSISGIATDASVFVAPDGPVSDLGLKGITDPSQTFLDSKGDPKTIRDLIRDGAKFEDDFTRPINHFYDPVNNRPLTVNGVPVGRASPNWAIDGTGDPDTTKFSFKAAREYLFKAVTDPSESFRRKQFGLLFETLGHVIHHVQDMAQPQHVRNDPHMDQLSLLGLNPLFNPSSYEKWTDLGAVRGALPFGGYAPTYSSSDRSTFDAARNFWHTPDGKGIADFTNRNFVSAGTNFDKPQLYPSPNFSTAFSSSAKIEDLCANAQPACENAGLTGTMVFYGTSVFDLYTGELIPNPRTSTLSLFDADLKNAGKDFVFTLNRFNFSKAHEFLIPRAVGYSAGLINYFFRGKIDYVPDPDVQGNFLIKNLGPEDMTGKFALYYDTKDGTRKEVPDRQGSAVVWQTQEPLVAKTGQMSVTPDFDPPADAKTLGEYMLVFTGDMGEEKRESGTVGAVVAKAVTNPYTGILYLAGENAAGQLQFFKIDRNGVSQATGAHPFSLAFVDHQVRERAYDYKQAILRSAPSGAVVYDIVGLELKTGSLGILANVSFLPHPATGVLTPRFGIAWTGYSPDPAIGTFEFTLNLQSSRSGTLQYTRRFTDSQGKPAGASGAVNLPDPISAGFTYADFTSSVLPSGKLIMSGDGTKIYPRGDTGTRKGLQITLGAVPTLAFFDLPRGTPVTLTFGPSTKTVTQSGVCTVDYTANNLVGGPNFPATATGQRVLTDDWTDPSGSGNFESSGSSIRLEDFVNGGLLSYERRSRISALHHETTESCAAAGIDWSAGGTVPQVKVNVRFSHHVQLKGEGEEEDVLPGGSFRFHSKGMPVARQATDIAMPCGIINGPAPSVGFPSTASGAPFLDIDYSYQGFGPCPAPGGTVYTLVNTVTENKRIYRALTDRSADAVYFDDGLLKFRSETVPVNPFASTGNFVADTSPLGEVFFATPDLSILHHEPKNGNMPTLTLDMIPSGIVRLVAAIWM